MIRRVIYALVWTVWWIPGLVSAVLVVPIFLIWGLGHWIIKGEELESDGPDDIFDWIYRLPDKILKKK